MPILLCAVLSLAVAWLRGAPPWRLAEVQLRWLFLPIFAFIVQMTAFGALGPAVAAHAVWIQVLTGGMLALFFVANARHRALVVVALGTLLNLTVITANGGYMPARPEDLERAGFPRIASQLTAAGFYEKTSVLDDRTRLPLLADVIWLQLPLAGTRLISAGDVLIGIGTFVFLQVALLQKERESGTGRPFSRYLSPSRPQRRSASLRPATSV